MREKNEEDLLPNIFEKNWREDFIFDSESRQILSYGKFLSAAIKISEKFSKLGLKKNDSLCIFPPNSLLTVILYFACLPLNIQICPIDPRRGQLEIEEILQLTKPKLVISNKHFKNSPTKKVFIGDLTKNLFKDGKRQIETKTFFKQVNYDKVFLITFTSGTTGKPKGVAHSLRNLIASSVAFQKRFGFNSQNKFYHNLPISYMAGILNLIFLPTISESKIVIGPRFDIGTAVKFWETPIRYSANTFWLTPTVIAMLLRLDRGTKGLNYTRKNKTIACVGTAPLNQKLREEFITRYKIQLFESYGLSETLFISTQSPFEKSSSKSVGKVLDGVRVGFGKDDEILINTDWMFLGYLGNTNHKVGDNFYSGDLGFIDKRDSLVITGRKKDLIIRGGININPLRIEEFISRFKFSTEHAVVGIEDEILGEKTVCFYVPQKNTNSETTKKINNQIVKQLGLDYKIDEFVPLSQIPKNINSKIDKIQIKKLYLKV